MAFLKADQVARAREKEEEKEIRARERQEDMAHILSLIKMGVEKVVKAALQRQNKDWKSRRKSMMSWPIS